MQKIIQIEEHDYNQIIEFLETVLLEKEMDDMRWKAYQALRILKTKDLE